MLQWLRTVKKHIYWMIKEKHISYAQEGEDMILRRLLEGRDKGFYVDVGAHHPRRFSNTYFFYKRGWSGINIDACPGSMKLFSLLRSRDINLECAIADEKKVLDYYRFNEPAVNGFYHQCPDRLKAYKLIEKVPIEALPLKEVLAKYIHKNSKIDFLSIDVEGLDEQVLRSNDWECYKPEIVLLESVDTNITDFLTSSTYDFMCKQGYVYCAKTMNTHFFRKV